MLRYFLILFYLKCVVCQDFDSEGSPCSWDGVRGRCVSVFKCLSSVIDIEAKKFPPVCSYDDKIPIICCTDCELVQDTRLYLFNPDLGLLNKTGTNKAKDKCLEFLHTLNYPCKQYEPNKISTKSLDPEKGCINLEQHYPPHGNAPAVSGGVDARRNQYPHMALLGYGDNIDTASWLCGGSVISERFILTAAHCLYEANVLVNISVLGREITCQINIPEIQELIKTAWPMSSSRLRGSVKFIGLGVLQRSDSSEVWQRYYVKNAIAHPEYKPPSKYNDIALLETDKQIAFNSEVLPACLHTDDNVDAYAFATGWGALGHRKDLADVLQSVGLHQYTSEDCSKYYPSHRHLLKGYDHTTQMCYGDKKDTTIPTDTCEGDSGGPLQSDAHEICVFTILGVTSFGRRCGQSGGTGIYTRVSHYVPWIESIVWPS